MSIDPEWLKHPEKLSQEQLLKLALAMRDDWKTLNEILNERARAQGWCGTYEKNQTTYNTRFKVFKLEGRPEHGDGGGFPERTGYSSYGASRPI